MDWTRIAASIACALGVGAGACVFELGAVVDGVGGSTGSGGQGAGGESGSSTRQVEVSLVSTSISNLSTPLTDFPVLVLLDASRIDYTQTQDDGADLRFFDLDGTTPLAHEIEQWNEAGESIVWVKLPVIEPSTSGILMRFGNPTTPDGQQPPAVWSRYHAVYHLSDDLAGSSQVTDSTGQLHGTAAGVAAVASGRIGRSMAFDGVSSRIDVANAPQLSIEPGQSLAYSLLFQRGISQIAYMAIGGTMDPCCYGWALRILGDSFANIRGDFGLFSAMCCGNTGGTVGGMALPMGASDQAWHHVVLSIDRASGTTALYLDGAPAGAPGTFATMGAMQVDRFLLGLDEYGMRGFVGELDEVRIAAGALSTDWARIEHLSHTDALVTFGPITIVGQ